MPSGILIHGKPGLGKTLVAKCFTEESGLAVLTVRRAEAKDAFMKKLENVFKEAKNRAPCIVFLDDMDKYANEDEQHCDAEEYVAIQTGIDDVKGMDVFVLATANDIEKLPKSLMRMGRFDRKIEVCVPDRNDADKIIKHYLKDKKVDAHINYEDITRMIRYNSCAGLETMLNEAAIIAGYAKHDSITMEDIVAAVLHEDYEAPTIYNGEMNDNLRKAAVHEAGHLVMGEILCPGSVGLVSISLDSDGDPIGFVRRCKNFPEKNCEILMALAGKVATELCYVGESVGGCWSDLIKAYRSIKECMNEGFYGIRLTGRTCFGMDISDGYLATTESFIHSELERYILMAKDIFAKNKAFLETATAALLEKRVLLYSDIKRIKERIADDVECA